jgi:hypothetical protein
VEALLTDQGSVSISATTAVSPLLGVASYRRAVKHLLASVVREICTRRSVGAGERATALGHPVGTGRPVSLPRSPVDRYTRFVAECVETPEGEMRRSELAIEDALNRLRPTSC